MSLEFNGLRVDELRGEENWPQWSLRIRSILVLSGHLWAWVDGDKILPPTSDTLIWAMDAETGEHVKRKVKPYELDEQITEWKKGNDSAHAMLCLCISFSVWDKVKWEYSKHLEASRNDDPTAREVWLALKRIFDSNSSLHRMKLQTEMDDMKLRPSESPVDLAWRIIGHKYRMEKCGFTVGDATIAFKLMELLPNNSGGYMARAQLLGDDDLSSEKVVSALKRCVECDAYLAVVERRQAAQGSRPSAEGDRPSGRRQRAAVTAANNGTPNHTTCK